jgi:hypothetical protein
MNKLVIAAAVLAVSGGSTPAAGAEVLQPELIASIMRQLRGCWHPPEAVAKQRS